VTTDSARDEARLPGWLAGVRVILGTAAGAALFAMMVLTFVDVVGRKFLSHSVVGSVELTEMMMLAMIFAAIPLASLAGEHVVFDLLDALLPDRVKYWQARLSNAVCTVLVGVAAWFVLNRAMRTDAMGDTTAQLLLPVAPFHYAAAVLLALCAFVHLYLAVTGKGRR
jgi:TRAP-type C4-dicarboxylate transport system permease small subunit